MESEVKFVNTHQHLVSSIGASYAAVPPACKFAWCQLGVAHTSQKFMKTTSQWDLSHAKLWTPLHYFALPKRGCLIKQFERTKLQNSSQ